MAVHLTILGSGSNGNCTYLESDQTRVLIDAGFSGRQIRQRMALIGRTPETLKGILITHEHCDHVKGLATIGAKLRIPLYCNRLTRDAIESQLGVPLEFRVFETGSRFEIEDLEVEAFSVPHDAQDPVGFLIRTARTNIGFLTDLGHATKLVLQRVRPAHALILEANHDLRMLQEDVRRPWSVKQRILSRHGHLSNDAAAAAIEQIVSADLQHLFLGHLSRDCNSPDLARRVLSKKLASLGADHVQLQSTSQDEACPTLSLT